MKLKSKFSKTIKFILDDFFPPIIRDSRFFYLPIIKLWNNKMDVDFKVKAHKMTEYEFIQAYEALVPMRATDNTPDTIDFVIQNVTGKSVLEVGCGNGDVSYLCAKKGLKTMATDLAIGNLNELKSKFDTKEFDFETKVANVENLPFDDNSFDTSICLHTLEHVRNLNLAIGELKRVTKKRIIIIVPKQRYSRYTADYHLNFFGNPDQLELAMGIAKSSCIDKDFCLCFIGDL
jgi:ubiquinone/menaquinone biosynthesis C-methylase UbiE